MRVKAASALLTGALMIALATGCGGGDDPTTPAPAGSEAGPGAPQPPANDSGVAPAAFNEDGATGTYDCAEQNVTINGHDADLHLTGPCAIVVVNGERSRVVIDDAQLIVVNGEGSEVTYAGEPEVVVNAEDASAEPVG